MEIEIRPARPEDATAAAPLLYSSGPAVVDYIFAHPAQARSLAFLTYAFAQGSGELGYRNHVVCVVDGNVVGLGATYSGEDMARFMLSAMYQIFAFYGVKTGARVIRRGLQIERVVQLPKKNIHYVAHLGIAPSHRGKGIGSKLMRYLLAEGQKRGRRIAALDVAATNPRAHELYKRLGFEVVDECVSNLKGAYGDVPNHYRMEKRI